MPGAAGEYRRSVLQGRALGIRAMAATARVVRPGVCDGFVESRMR